MTFPNHPNHVHQAAALLETGKCDLPVDMHNVAQRVAAHPLFASALQKAHNGNPRTLNILTMNAALKLCEEQDRAA